MEKLTFEYPVTIDTKYYTAIGEIAVRSAWLEHRLHVLIREVLRLTKSAGRISVYGKELRVLADILETAAESSVLIPNGTLGAALVEYAKDVGAISKQRGNYVHGVYGPRTGKPNTFYRIVLKNQMEAQGQPFTPTSVAPLAALLRQLQERGLELTAAVKKLRKGTKL